MILLTMTGFEKGCERVENAFRGLPYAVRDDHDLTVSAATKQLLGGRRDGVHDGNTKNQSSSAALPIMYSLIHWRAERVGGLDTYLRHDPVRLFIRHDFVLDDAAEADLFVDESVLDDADAFEGQIKEAASSSSSVRDDYAIETVWIFTIVYSHTWMCPVLYFNITGPDGSALLSRDSVVRIVCSFHDQNPGSEDTWEFVSMEEHPIFGAPAFMLHPCRTAERLNVLFRSCNDPLVNDDAGRILVWMSMILPSVGFGIPSRLYLHLRDVLKIPPRDGWFDEREIDINTAALSPTR
jgi:Autophagocytosis associated protein, active-site domain